MYLCICLMYISYINLRTLSLTSAQRTLLELQLRLGTVLGRRVGYGEMATLANTSQRTISEWMRGATTPQAMIALLNLLSELPAEHAAAVLAVWKKGGKNLVVAPLASEESHDA